LNILTKISIVVLVVLVLVVSAAFITLATVTPAYRDAWQKEKNIAAMNALLANQKEAALQRTVQLLNKTDEDRLKAENATIETKRAGDGQALKLQGDLDQEKRKSADLTAQVALLTVSVKSQVDLASAFKTANDKLKEQADALALENGKLQQKYQEVDGLAKRYEQQIVVDQENIKNLQDQLVVAKTAHVAPQPGAVEGAIAAGGDMPRYSGTITAVKGDLASINIGSANGVKQGDKCYIYRGSQFIGYLRIERVDSNDSAGVVTEKQANPMQNDKVTNRLQ
jgi:hypothetical protein